MRHVKFNKKRLDRMAKEIATIAFSDEWDAPKMMLPRYPSFTERKVLEAAWSILLSLATHERGEKDLPPSS